MVKLHAIDALIGGADLRRWRSEFHASMAPLDLARGVVRLGELLGTHVVDSAHAEFWRTAYHASAFALSVDATSVRLLEDVRTEEGRIPPDFEIVRRGRTARYELVEALAPGRRRDAEFREDREHGPRVRSEEVPAPEEVASILSAACAKKIPKAARYDRVDGLIVVLGVWSLMGDALQDDVWTMATAEAGKRFDEVWIVYGDASRLVWSGGRPALAWSDEARRR